MNPLYNYDGETLAPRTINDAVFDGYNVPLPYYLANPRMKGVNHRGYSTAAPENTLPAYVLSYLHGFKFVECDICFTSDGVAVLLHDTTISRTSDGSGNINSLTFAQVREYDFGSWFSPAYAGTKIPSLREFLILCRNLGLHPYLELKTTAHFTTEQLQEIVDMVDALGMKGKVTYISFSDTYLNKIVTYDKTARVGFLDYSVSATTITKALALRTGYNEVFIDSQTYTTSEIELCEADGIPLEIWTLDNATTIAGLADYISGVTSNDKNAGFIKIAKTLEDNPLPIA